MKLSLPTNQIAFLKLEINTNYDRHWCYICNWPHWFNDGQSSSFSENIDGDPDPMTTQILPCIIHHLSLLYIVTFSLNTHLLPNLDILLKALRSLHKDLQISHRQNFMLQSSLNSIYSHLLMFELEWCLSNSSKTSMCWPLWIMQRNPSNVIERREKKEYVI